MSCWVILRTISGVRLQINILQLHVRDLLLWVHHHWVGGGVGVLVQFGAHNRLDLKLDRQHWLWSDSDDTVTILILFNVTRTYN